jgi:signal transduction histidine kinase
VLDEGPGVPAAERDTIFHPFTHGIAKDPSTPGAGIGLALVAHVAELHGGRAWVEPRRDRPGSDFRMFLPAEILRPAA